MSKAGVKVTQIFPSYKDSCKLTEFAGYLLPLYFKGIIDEVLAVRNSVGVFDVSHMGRIELQGDDASNLLENILTISVTKGEPGRAMYGFMCNERGGVVDDLITYKHTDKKYTLVVNCSNREKDLAWMRKSSGGMNVEIKDITDESILIAVQGPSSSKMLDEFGVGDIKRFRFNIREYYGNEMMIARTGYTGEDGYELLLRNVTHSNPDKGIRLWEHLSESAAIFSGLNCGLGARDTLRIEAGLPLHGNDISEDISPVEAGLERFVDFQKTKFIGKDALEEIRERKHRTMVALVLKENIIPRSHCRVFMEGEEVGIVTSGTYSPVLKKGIAMALVNSELKKGDLCEVEVRGARWKAEITGFPFYEVEKYGYRRRSD
ncbi:MAG: glycine cleavage system aminomethyltransferase GcvT [Conexivisphaerales archaeon]